MSTIPGVHQQDNRTFIKLDGREYDVYITSDEVRVMEPEGDVPRNWPWEGCDVVRARYNLSRLLLKCDSCVASRERYCWCAPSLMVKKDKKCTNICRSCSSTAVKEIQQYNSQWNLKKRARSEASAAAAAAAALAAVAPQHKTCSCCGEDKLLDDFGRQSNRSSGYRSCCRQCTNEQVRHGNEGIRLLLHAQLSRVPMCEADAAAGHSNIRDKLGYGLQDFIAHFDPMLKSHGWTWDDRGSKQGHWTIGHKVPCAAFDLRDPEHVKQCFALSNLYPQEAKENYADGGRIHGLSRQQITDLLEPLQHVEVIDLCGPMQQLEIIDLTGSGELAALLGFC